MPKSIRATDCIFSKKIFWYYGNFGNLGNSKIIVFKRPVDSMLGRWDEEDAEYYGNLGNVSNCLIFSFFNCSYFGNFGNYGNFDKLNFLKLQNTSCGFGYVGMMRWRRYWILW